jgi:hypothetical protein
MLTKFAFGVLASLLALTAAAQAADTYVRGYTRSNGTYVEPHMRSAPDSTVNNNYSTQGNINPYTGDAGTRPQNPYEPMQPYQPYQPYGTP